MGLNERIKDSYIVNTQMVLEIEDRKIMQFLFKLISILLFVSLTTYTIISKIRLQPVGIDIVVITFLIYSLMINLFLTIVKKKPFAKNHYVMVSTLNDLKIIMKGTIAAVSIINIYLNVKALGLFDGTWLDKGNNFFSYVIMIIALITFITSVITLILYFTRFIMIPIKTLIYIFNSDRTFKAYYIKNDILYCNTYRVRKPMPLVFEILIKLFKIILFLVLIIALFLIGYSLIAMIFKQFGWYNV